MNKDANKLIKKSFDNNHSEYDNYLNDNFS